MGASIRPRWTTPGRVFLVIAAAGISTSGCFNYATRVTYRRMEPVSVEKWIPKEEKGVPVISAGSTRENGVIYSGMGGGFFGDGALVAKVTKEGDTIKINCEDCTDEEAVLVQGRAAETYGDVGDTLDWPGRDKVNATRFWYTYHISEDATGYNAATVSYVKALVVSPVGNVEKVERVRHAVRKWGLLLIPAAAGFGLGGTLIGATDDSTSQGMGAIPLVIGAGLAAAAIAWLVMPEKAEVIDPLKSP